MNSRTIRKVRTEHGTRVARQIVCASCGQSDTVEFIPREVETVLCRKCAYEKLAVLDPDSAALRSLNLLCGRCGVRFLLDRPEAPAEPLCADCHHGIETRQQDRAKRAVRVSGKVVRVQRRS